MPVLGETCGKYHLGRACETGCAREYLDIQRKDLHGGKGGPPKPVAVILSLMVPGAAGVKDNVAVPFLLSVNFIPCANAPRAVTAGVGSPVVVTVKEPGIRHGWQA